MSNCGLNTEYSSHDNISLSDYDFKSTIGKGTFGKVKLAVYKQTNQNRAIKILNKKQIETKKEMHLVKRELNALKILSHPNLVHVNQIFQDSENYYIDMEYCENGELFDYIVKKHQLTENEICFLVKKGTALSHFAPKFQITPGATLSPANGSVQDFTNGQVTYTVTSEDGNWKRQYRVGFIFPPVVYEVMKYDFENYFLNENKPVHKYYVWSDKNDDGTLANNWATGNPGFYKQQCQVCNSDRRNCSLAERGRRLGRDMQI